MGQDSGLSAANGPTQEEFYEIKRELYPASELWQIAEQQAKAAREADDPRQIRRHAMSAIVFANFAFEAYLNVSCETLMGKEVWAALDEGKSLSTTNKLVLAGLLIGAKALTAREPFQSVLNTKKLRNFAGHGRPVTATGQVVIHPRRPTELSPDFEEAKRQRAMEPIIVAERQNVALTDVEKQCTPENARRAVEAVMEAADELFRLADEAKNAGRIEHRIERIFHRETVWATEISNPASPSRKFHVETVVDTKDPEPPSDPV